MISHEAVTETWQRIAQSSVEDAQRYAYQMSVEQPVLQRYLLELDDLPFNRNETEIIHYVGLVTWQIMKHGRRPLRGVTVKRLQRAERANGAFLEMLASDTEADFVSATLGMLENYPEPEVLRYIVEAIMEEDEEDPEEIPIRDEYRGLAFLHLKVMLDAMVDG